MRRRRGRGRGRIERGRLWNLEGLLMRRREGERMRRARGMGGEGSAGAEGGRDDPKEGDQYRRKGDNKRDEAET
jgi:hypothetical protein